MLTYYDRQAGYMIPRDYGCYPNEAADATLTIPSVVTAGGSGGSPVPRESERIAERAIDVIARRDRIAHIAPAIVTRLFGR